LRDVIIDYLIAVCIDLLVDRCPERGLPDGSITRGFQKTSKHEFAVQQGELFWMKAFIGKNRTYPELTPCRSRPRREPVTPASAFGGGVVVAVEAFALGAVFSRALAFGTLAGFGGVAGASGARVNGTF
jgi:hypothetical protein